ncbi:general stress protein A [Enterococcus sp. AZ081]
MENRKELAIVSCCNTNFVPHLAAMFVSILENHPYTALYLNKLKKVGARNGK